MEHEVAKELGKMSGAVIACGGGIVTREYNYDPLHQNSTIVFLERKLSNLSTKGRPLSQSNSLQALYDARIDAYCRFADIRVKSTEVPENTATLIIEKLGGQSK
jgi:shikimate dehydrogenase